MVAALAVMPVPLAVAVAPSATAIVPPVVDSTLLPAPAAPAPAHRTEQREQCFGTPTRDTVTVGTPLGLEAVWRLTRGSGQTVAVIDTGVARHRLLPHLVGGGDYVSSGDGTADCDGHGTIVAGIIGGAPTAEGFSGVAPDATILAIRQSSNKFAVGTGSRGVGDVSTLAKAVRTAADLGASVINISSVACVAADDAVTTLDDRTLGAALSYAVDVKNVVVVAAAGNVGGPGHCPQQNPSDRPDWDNLQSVASPAWYDELVLCVGSVGRGGAASIFSLGGPWVDVAAVGEDIVSLHPDGDQLIDVLGDAKPISGTSYAAPMVAGLAALVRSRFPQLTAREVMRRIETTAHRPPGGWDPFIGNGTIDPLAAVSGGPPATDAQARNLPTVTQPAVAPVDARPRTTAFVGAAVCVAAASLVALALSTKRLRRSPGGHQPVAHD
ncbi:type VII secretion-associated serine protease mycosin [Mycolicibacterium sp. XJ870]